MSIKVSSSGSKSLGIIPEVAQPSVTWTAQRTTDLVPDMAMIELQDAVDAHPAGWSVADEAQAVLLAHHHLEVGLADPVLADSTPLSGFDSVGTAVLSGVGDSLFSVLRGVSRAALLLDNSTDVGPIGSESDWHQFSTPTTVGDRGFGVHVRQPVPDDESSGAGKTTDSILLDRDSTASRAVSLSVEQIEIRQSVGIASLRMTPPESNRFPLDPATFGGVLGGDAGGFTASAVAGPEGDNTVLGASANTSHRKDCTS